MFLLSIDQLIDIVRADVHKAWSLFSCLSNQEYVKIKVKVFVTIRIFSLLIEKSQAEKLIPNKN